MKEKMKLCPPALEDGETRRASHVSPHGESGEEQIQ